MGPKTPVNEGDLLRYSLCEQINLNYPLVRLADLADWERLAAAISESFMSKRGRPATPPRLIARLLYSQHALDQPEEKLRQHRGHVQRVPQHDHVRETRPRAYRGRPRAPSCGDLRRD